MIVAIRVLPLRETTACMVQASRLAVTVTGHFACKDDVITLPRLHPGANVLVRASLLVCCGWNGVSAEATSPESQIVGDSR